MKRKLCKIKTIHCVFVEAFGTESLFNPNKNLKTFLKHPDDNRMGDDISVSSSSHHAKQCLPYSAAAVKVTDGVKDENDSRERSMTQ